MQQNARAVEAPSIPPAPRPDVLESSPSEEGVLQPYGDKLYLIKPEDDTKPAAVATKRSKKVGERMYSILFIRINLALTFIIIELRRRK